MTSLDGLWYLAHEAAQRAAQAFHRTAAAQRGTPPRADPPEARLGGRFRTLAERIRCCGAPYGAHTLVHRDDGELLLVRHEGVDPWVLPGGGVDAAETYREAAERELRKEAGLDAAYEGLAMLNRVEIRCEGRDTWGVIPVFAARTETTDPTGRHEPCRPVDGTARRPADSHRRAGPN